MPNVEIQMSKECPKVLNGEVADFPLSGGLMFWF
ncbi:hypothetical protein DSM3645_10887 [Blastopirellula marina DSM 3645]|uniref:Uncharacterized protein n=1 Tax=Blastopirellula marina DSM 3645 TaxID=314230 RepID=A3ZSS1_9BACT|nr:hypothetical protein DSM3645_10887 [Blastopirellula marina DSM 3645]